jgi:hypothetical protein
MRAYEFLTDKKLTIKEQLSQYENNTKGKDWIDVWVVPHIKENSKEEHDLILSEVFNNDLRAEKLVNDFIKTHKVNSLTPVIGEKFSPLGFILNGPLQRLQIISSENAMELIKIDPPKNYVFNCNGIIQFFPFEHINFATAGDTFFYNLPAESAAMITNTALAVNFNGWEVEKIVISKDGIRNIEKSML